MIDAPDFLPLGSVVSLKGNPKTLMIIGRGVVLAPEQEKEYYDYSLILYPEGLVGDAALFAQHEQIETVHFKGYVDEANDAWMRQVHEALDNINVPRAAPELIGMEW